MNHPPLGAVGHHSGLNSALAQPLAAVEESVVRVGASDSPAVREQINLARFDLTTFYLVTLCAERGSLCEAARAAHISKSAASHRITALENYLGTKLFHRTHSGLELTQAGVLCVERSRLVVEAVRSLGRQIAGPALNP